MLSVVSTPIGNLQDFCPRAIEVLRQVELVLVEDTRSFSVLARKFDINTPTKSYFDHNERGRTAEVIARLEAGSHLALVSEAGTPTISDPGYRIVRACREKGISVTGVPGPNAAIFALSISGLPSDRFFFQGFLPQRPGRKLSTLRSLLELGATSILYESPHRIQKTLKQVAEIAPEAEVFVGRELTKLHEESVWGKASEVAENFATRTSVRGEIVLVIGAYSNELSEQDEPEDDLEE